MSVQLRLEMLSLKPILTRPNQLSQASPEGKENSNILT